MICPKCGSKDIIPVIYGRPSPELSNRAENGEVRLGECLVANGAADKYCKSCNNLRAEMGKENNLEKLVILRTQ